MKIKYKSKLKMLLTWVLVFPLVLLFQNCGDSFELIEQNSGVFNNDIIAGDQLLNPDESSVDASVDLPTDNQSSEKINQLDDLRNTSAIDTIIEIKPNEIIPVVESVVDKNEWKPIQTKNINTISVDDFPVGLSTSKINNIRSYIGHKNYYNKISYFFSNLEDVYDAFNIKKDDVLTCDRRHQQALDLNFNSTMKLRARNYFCLGEFNTKNCKVKQYKKVYLGYCLDGNDTLDWLALQASILNANNRTVIIPANRNFNINQALVIPSNTTVRWLGTKEETFNGISYNLERASFINFRQLKLEGYKGPEPLVNSRGLGFSTGTVLALGNMPFLYSGPAATQKNGITKNVTFLHPHINANYYKGENAISFAQGVIDSKIIGGHLKNISINTTQGVAWAGGKAIQCEAGCVNIKINGIKISNSHIGINSTASHEYLALQNGLNLASDIGVDGVEMNNVDIPINVLNTYENQVGTQKVRVNNFLIKNSGRMSNEVFQARRDHLNRNSLYSRVLNGEIVQMASIQSKNQAKSYDLGIISSRNGYNVLITNGEFINSNQYGGIEEFISGYGKQVQIRNSSYSTPINCELNKNLSGC